MSAVRTAMVYRIEQNALIFVSIFRLKARVKNVPVRLRVRIKGGTPLNFNTVLNGIFLSHMCRRRKLWGSRKNLLRYLIDVRIEGGGECRSLTRL